MAKFWLNVFFASGAVFLAFTSPSHSESRAWIVGLWGVFGCFPWLFFLPLISADPNGQITLAHITAMSTLNALLLYAMCRAELLNIGFLRYVGYQLGRHSSRVRKWH